MEYIAQQQKRASLQDWQGRMWEKALLVHFLAIPHINDAHKVLRLRRNLQETFIMTEDV